MLLKDKYAVKEGNIVNNFSFHFFFTTFEYKLTPLKTNKIKRLNTKFIKLSVIFSANSLKDLVDSNFSMLLTKQLKQIYIFKSIGNYLSYIKI